MLPIPTSIVPGYETGEDTTRYADWVEASVLFTGERVSKADVRDYFYEENTFQRGNADETVDNIWSELTGRARMLAKAYPLGVRAQRVESRINWDKCPAYALNLFLSYSRSNAEWEHDQCSDYQIQGELFEQVAAAALKAMLAVWDVIPVGWSANHPERLKTQIQDICDRLGERPGQETPREVDKDGGVDVMCYRAFPDRRGDYPVFFIQCATGRNWTDKRMVNTLNLWTNWIHFRAPHLLSRGFAIPFSLKDDAFFLTQMCVDGLVLDRTRLFSMPSSESKWLPDDIRQRILQWLGDKLDRLAETVI